MRKMSPSPLRCALALAGLAGACLLGPLPPVGAQATEGAASTAASPARRNVYAAGGQVRPPAAVAGDFTAAGGKVIVDQPVGGDASLAGGSVDVRAAIGDDLRAAGGDISIESTTGGEVVATGGNITLLPAATVARGATLYGGNVRVDGRVDGDLQVAARSITIDGEVRGNAHLNAEEIELGPKARISGNLNYPSRARMKKADSAVIAGSMTRDGEASGRSGRQWEGSVRGPSWAGGVMAFVALLACAALVLLLVPRFGEDAARRIQSSPWLSLGVGFGTVIAVPVFGVLLFITILGIPLGIVLMALFPALLLGGFVVGVLCIGRLLARALRQQSPASFGRNVAYAAAALLLTMAATLVPFAGGLFAGLLSLAGVGACVVELYQRRKGPRGGITGGRPLIGVPAEAH